MAGIAGEHGKNRRVRGTVVRSEIKTALNTKRTPHARFEEVFWQAMLGLEVKNGSSRVFATRDL